MDKGGGNVEQCGHDDGQETGGPLFRRAARGNAPARGLMSWWTQRTVPQRVLAVAAGVVLAISIWTRKWFDLTTCLAEKD